MVRTPWLICMLFALTLSACGFHLREQATFALPFQSLYVKAASNYSPFIIELKQAVVMNGTQVEESPETAQVTLEIVSEVADKQILSLSGAGRVREYRLQYRVSLRLVDSQQKEWLHRAISSCTAITHTMTRSCWPRKRKKPCSIRICVPKRCSRYCAV